MVNLKQTVVNQFADLLVTSDQNPLDYEYVIICNILYVRYNLGEIDGVVAVKYYKFAEQDVKNKSSEWLLYLQSKVNDLLFGKYEKNSVKISLKYFDSENECVENFIPKNISSWIVSLEEGSTIENVTNIPTKKVIITNTYEYVLNGFSCVTDSACICYMKTNNSCIESIQTDTRVRATANNKVQTVGQFIRRIGANNSSSQCGTQKPIIPVNPNIYAFVFDTGILANHPDLNIATKYCINFTNSVKTFWNDENGHGTHVAGILGAKDNNIGIVGVAPNVNLVAVKVLKKDGSGLNSSIIAALDYVYKWKTSNPNLRAIVNMSLGGNFDATLNNATNKLCNYNVPICVAAGNDSRNASKESPASAVNAITVGAYNSLNNKLADFSNFGSLVDILAPGVDIDSCWLNKGYKVESGTSMASPVVAGTIALLITSDNSYTTTAKIRNELINESSKLKPENYNETIGSNPRITLNPVASSAKTTNIGIWAGYF